MIRIGKNFSYLTAGTIIEKILKFFIVIILVRYLDPIQFGQYSLVISFVGLFMHFLDGGFNLLLLREIPKVVTSRSKVFGQLIGGKLIIGPIILVFIVLCAHFFRYNSQTIINILMYGFSMLIFTFSKSFMNLFIAIEKAEYECYLITGYALLLFIGITLCAAFHTTVFFVMVAYLLSSSVIVYAGCLFSKKLSIFPEVSINKINTLKIFKKTIPFALGAIMGEIFFNIDNVMISKIVGIESVGFYNSAYKLSYTGVLLANTITLSTYPLITKNWEKDKEFVYLIFEKVFTLIIGFGLAITLVFTIVADEIIVSFFGIDYRQSILLFKILVWSLPPLCLIHLTGRTLDAVGLQRLTAKSMIISVIVNLVLNLFLIISLGTVGAAIATVVSSFVVVLLQFYYLKTNAHFSLPKLPLMNLLLSLTILCCAIIFFRKYNWVLGTIGGVIVYWMFFLRAQLAIFKR